MCLPRFDVHNHSEFSNFRLLDCINKIPALIKRAKDIGLKGFALTDHETLSGSIIANKLALAEEGDFKIAIGNEIYLVDSREMGIRYYHFILIAKDAEGHRLLRELSSQAWLNSYYDRGMERVPTLRSELEEIVSKNKGHLIATTACIGGFVSSSILAMENARKIGDAETANAEKTKIIEFVLWAKELFGDDFYFEVAPAASREQIIVNKKMVELGQAFGVKLVIGSDAHYLSKEDRYVHKAFLNSKGGEREVDDFYEYAYMQSEKEIIENLSPSIVDLYEEMCKNSMEIYDKIERYSLLHSQQIPKVPLPHYQKQNFSEREKYPVLQSLFSSEDNTDRCWVNRCVEQLKKRKLYNPTYLQRLEEEADIKQTIGQKLGTNMFSYPLSLQYYIDIIWECGSIVGAGRGSSCSGLNHLLLGITQLNPVEWKLPFYRYMNKERTEIGDIDIDICPSKRPAILQRIKEERATRFLPEINKITRENCGCTLVATFGTETSKSAVLTAVRGYRSEEFPEGLDSDFGQYLSSLIPTERGFVYSLKDVVYGNEEKGRKPVAAFVNEVSQYDRLLEIMFGIEGLISRRGSHASGVILFDEDPYEFGCFMRTPSGEVITQYDLHNAEAAGMTKFDL